MATRNAANFKSKLQNALENLQAFHWPSRRFKPEGALLDELEGQVRLFNLHEPGDIDEAEFRSRWLRTKVMQANEPEFRKLTELAHDFFLRLTEVGKQDALATIAGLTSAPPPKRPSEFVYFQPCRLPERPPLNFAAYQMELGGPLTFGANILWWSAAAADPNGFGLYDGFALDLLIQPFWVNQQRVWECRFNDKALSLLKDAANKATSTDPIAGENPLALPPQQDGPDDGLCFWLNGRSVQLKPKPHHFCSAIWKAKDHRILGEDLCEQVWGDQAPNRKTVDSTRRRANESLEPLDIEIVCEGERYSFQLLKA